MPDSLRLHIVAVNEAGRCRVYAVAQAEALRAAFLCHAVLLRVSLATTSGALYKTSFFHFPTKGGYVTSYVKPIFYITSTSAPEIQDDLKPNSEFLLPQSLQPQRIIKPNRRYRAQDRRQVEGVAGVIGIPIHNTARNTSEYRTIKRYSYQMRSARDSSSSSRSSSSLLKSARETMPRTRPFSTTGM